MMVYAIKNKDEILFAQELIKYKVKYVMGHLQKDNLKELVPDIASREVYICGPEGFNQSMKQYAREFGVKYTHLEEFST
jgi:ferredoxin-NADP reductase